MLRLILAASVTESATAVSIAAVTFSEPACRSAARSLAVEAVRLTNSRAASGTSRFWRFLSASVTGAKASLTVFSTELVSVVITVSPSSGFELWAHPVRIGPGRDPCAIVNGASQHQCCDAISRISDRPLNCAFSSTIRLCRPLPTALPAIPRVQQIGAPIVHDARNWSDHRQADQPPEPDVTGRSKPDRDRAVDPRVKPVLGIDGMQPAPDVVDPDAEAGQRIRLQIDVTKIDGAGSGRANQPMMLPVNAGVTDRTFGVVPNGEFFRHYVVAQRCRSRLTRLALQLPFLKVSESMGNHDSKIVDAYGVD